MELTHTSFKDLCAYCVKQFQSQNWKAARESAREILEQFPDQPHGIAWLTIASWHLGNTDESKTMADEAIKQFPDNAWVWENRARLAGFAQDWALAGTLWQACTERFPRSPGAYAEGSKAYLHIAEPKKAIKLVDAGLALYPNNWHLLIAQANYFVEQSEWEAAQETWLSICEKFPNNEFARRKAIDIFHRVQNHVGAFNTVMEWIASSAPTLPNDYSLAVKAFIRAFNEFDLSDKKLRAQFWLLVTQPLDKNKPSDVVELVKTIQSLPLLDTPKYQKIVKFSQILFSEDNQKAGSTARTFSLAIGVPELNLSKEELFELVSDSDIDRFSRFFSGYLPHVDNVKALMSLLPENSHDEFLDKISKRGLENLRLFAAANPDIDREFQKKVEEKLGFSGLGSRKLAPAYNRNKLRIAVCVSGQLRGYQAAFKTWERLHLEEHDTHYFVHCWHDIGQKYPAPVNARRSFSGNFLPCFVEESGAYGFAHIVSEYPSLFSFYRTSLKAKEADIARVYSTESVVLEDDTKGKFESFTNPMKMFYKIEKSWNLARQSGLDFDLVIRARPDKALTVRQKVDWNKIYQVCSTSPTIYTDGPFRINYDLNLITGDQFAISTPDIMAHYSRIFSSTLDENGVIKDPSEYKHVHRKLAFTLYDQGIVGRQNPFIQPGFPLDPEKLKPATILKLIMEDIDKREVTRMDKKFIDALSSDI